MKVRHMSGMFRGVNVTATSFNGNISKCEVSSVVSMDNMFRNAASFKQTLCGSRWLHSKAIKTGMFVGSYGRISTAVCARKIPESRVGNRERELCTKTNLAAEPAFHSVKITSNEDLKREVSCSVSKWQASNAKHMTEIAISDLKTNGFAVINMPSIAPTLASATSSFAKLNQFRYPRDNYNEHVNANYQDAFNAMYFFAASCLHQLCPEFPLPPLTTAPFDMGNESPFGGSKASRDLPYADSFANIFNYNHGFLNAHLDRGLLTAVFGQTEHTTKRQREPTVGLWCQRLSTGEWVNLSERTGEHDIVIFVGEQLEHATKGAFKAVKHASVVDPNNAGTSRLTTQTRNMTM